MKKRAARGGKKQNASAAPASVFAVCAQMIDGSSRDLLLFRRAEDAEQHAAYVRKHCAFLGYDSLIVVERVIVDRPFVAAPAVRPSRLLH